MYRQGLKPPTYVILETVFLSKVDENVIFQMLVCVTIIRRVS
jgi:hypothetical protein